MSPDQRAEILRGIEAGEPVLDILARIGLPTAWLYSCRRRSPAFEQQYMAAAKRARNSKIKPIGHAPLTLLLRQVAKAVLA